MAVEASVRGISCDYLLVRSTTHRYCSYSVGASDSAVPNFIVIGAGVWDYGPQSHEISHLDSNAVR